VTTNCPLARDGLDPLLEGGDDLLFGPVGLLGSNVNVVRGELLKLAGHDQEANHSVINLLEGEGATLGEFIDVAIEPMGELSPMQRRVHVVTNVVTVVVGQLVHLSVDDIVSEVIRILVVLRVHKDVLRKVSEHKKERRDEVRHNKGPPCRLGTHAGV